MGQGALGQANQQAMQGNQALGQQVSQLGQAGGGGMSMGDMLAQQIQQMKSQLGHGQMTEGTASSGWGTGTSPYAVAPAPAPNIATAENKQGQRPEGDRSPVDFEAMYEGQDVGHAFGKDGQLHGRFDMTQPPQKVEEVRSAPETQEALRGYASIIGSYADGEENAVAQEEIPEEYKELVKQYFDQIQRDAKKTK
jgi:hypothetical protein